MEEKRRLSRVEINHQREKKKRVYRWIKYIIGIIILVVYLIYLQHPFIVNIIPTAVQNTLKLKQNIFLKFMIFTANGGRGLS